MVIVRQNNGNGQPTSSVLISQGCVNCITRHRGALAFALLRITSIAEKYATGIFRSKARCLEPISKLSEEDNEAGELDKAEEVLSVEFPTDEYAALPLYPGEETLDEPASHIAAQPSSILCWRLDAIGAVWRDHLDTISSQFLVERIAVIGTVADQVFRLGFDHVEVEAQLHQADLVVVRGMRADRKR